MTTLEVLPRPTPEERDDSLVEIPVDDRFTELVATIEDWVTPRQGWEFTLHEGHDFGRANNVEGRLLFAQGEQTSTLSFRLEQLETADEVLDELVLRFEEQDGICKAARVAANGMHVEFFHILTFT